MGPPLGQALEFLSQVLSQRGPQAVPYSENYKWNIREHLSELLKVFPSLTVSASEFHTNDGRVLNLLKAQGTVPIHYQGIKYNIPVIIWLPERYPVHAPLVYVTPTPSMVIKHNHSCVDASGQVRTPYIAGWLYPSSDLSSMAQEMAMLFGAEPPLYSKPAGYTPPPPAAGQAHMQQNLQQAGAGGGTQQAGYPPVGYGAGASQQQQQQAGRPPPPGAASASQQQQYPPVGPGGWGGAAAGAGASGAFPPIGGGLPGAGPSGSFSSAAGAAGAGTSGSPPRQGRGGQADLEEAFAGLAARALAGRLQAGLEAFNRDAAREMDGLLEAQRQLAAREQELQRAVGSVQQERAGTEGIVAELGAKCRQLEAWLEANEWKAAALAPSAAPTSPSKRRGGGGGGGSGADAAAELLAKLDVGKAVVPADDLCRQALAAQAEDLAVEDALTVLDKALQGGKVAVDAYIRQSRALCRAQFFARARGLKIAQLQQLAAARSPRGGAGARGPAAGAAGYAMVQGDGWSGPSPVAGAAARGGVR